MSSTGRGAEVVPEVWMTTAVASRSCPAPARSAMLPRCADRSRRGSVDGDRGAVDDPCALCRMTGVGRRAPRPPRAAGRRGELRRRPAREQRYGNPVAGSHSTPLELGRRKRGRQQGAPHRTGCPWESRALCARAHGGSTCEPSFDDHASQASLRPHPDAVIEKERRRARAHHLDPSRRVHRHPL